MTTYLFSSVAGTSISFNAATDQISFTGGFVFASELSFSVAGSDLLVTRNGSTVRLLNTLYSQLTQTSLVFADNDSLFLPGTAGNDTLTGTYTHDYLDAGSGGSDVIAAGDGYDTIVMGAGLDSSDQISGSFGNDTLHLSGNYASVVTLGANTITGVEFFVFEHVGNGGVVRLELHDNMFADTDLILEFDASTQLAGDGVELDGSALVSGTMEFTGGAGADTVTGGSQDDELEGEAGDDTLSGGEGNDLLFAGDGDDSLTGGNGNDSLVVGFTNGPAERGNAIDTLDGGAGNDTIQLGGDRGIFTGGSGADTYFTGEDATANLLTLNDLSSVAVSDRITDFNAGEGDKLFTGIVGGLAVDDEDGALRPVVFRGDAGVGFTGTVGQSMSLAAGSNPSDSRFIELYRFQYSDGSGTHTVLFSDRNLNGVVDATDMRLEFDGAIVLDEASFSNGTFGAQLGTVGNDTDTTPNLTTDSDYAFALAGNDTLTGLAGHDILNGDAGNDTIDGGDDDDSLYGGTGDDQLTGGVGNDALFGGAGADTLQGGDGDDYLEAANYLDFIEQDIGDDPSTDDSPGTVNQLYGGAGNDDMYGGAGNDQLYGDADDDGLRGNGGADTLDGGNGSDYMEGGDGDDVLIGGGDASTDQMYGEAGSDSLSGGDGDDFLYVGSTAGAAARGNATDTLDAGAGNDDIYFRGSNPGERPDRAIVTGGAGADEFILGGFALQTYNIANGNEMSSVAVSDRITDFNAAEGDLLNLGSVYGLVTSQDTGASLALVFRGVAGVGFTGTVGQSMTLAGSDPSDMRYLEFYTFQYNDGADHTVLFADRNLNGTVDSTDLRLEFDGAISLTASSFVFGTFYVKFGTAGDDTNVTPAMDGNVDVVYALGGSDTLNGLGGNDIISGDAGNDTLDGGTHDDKLYGGADDDNLLGGTGNDELHGGSGADTLTGDDGNDILYAAGAQDARGLPLVGDMPGTVNLLFGGLGNDTYFAATANDIIIENFNEGIDTVMSGRSFTLGNNIENLTLTGSAAINGTGNALDNVLTGNSGVNMLSGGAGNDTYIVQNTSDMAIEAVGEGTDVVQSSVTYTLGAEVENLVLTGVAAINGSGNGLANVLNGNSGNNVLNGGAGADTMTGGAGNDTYVVDDVADAVSEAVNMGTDLVQASLTYTLGAHVENLTLTGTAAINGTGNGLANVLTGNSNNNTLTGGAGNDTLFGSGGTDILVGGADDDSYTVNSAGDVVTEAADEGTDSVFSDIAWTLANNIENLTLTGIRNVNITGNGLANVLTGNSGNNTLNGGAGADTMAGGGGGDTYVVDDVGDVITEALNAGTDSVQSSITHTLAANVENLTLTGAAAINGTGNGLNNILNGNSAANTLTGGGGADTLNGGSGVDTLIGGAGNDTYLVDNTSTDTITENSGEGNDLVRANVSYTLGANLENLILISTSNFNGTGNAANNVLTGNSGNNNLNGGAGRDTLNGGLGADRFVFSAATDTAPDAQRDVIADFLAADGDKVNLSAIDAVSSVGGNQAFTYIGTAAFSGTDASGQLRFSGGVLFGSTDADNVAEFSIALTGVASLTVNELIL